MGKKKAKEAKTVMLVDTEAALREFYANRSQEMADKVVEMFVTEVMCTDHSANFPITEEALKAMFKGGPCGSGIVRNSDGAPFLVFLTDEKKSAGTYPSAVTMTASQIFTHSVGDAGLAGFVLDPFDEEGGLYISMPVIHRQLARLHDMMEPMMQEDSAMCPETSTEDIGDVAQQKAKAIAAERAKCEAALQEQARRIEELFADWDKQASGEPDYAGKGFNVVDLIRRLDEYTEAYNNSIKQNQDEANLAAGFLDGLDPELAKELAPTMAGALAKNMPKKSPEQMKMEAICRFAELLNVDLRSAVAGGKTKGEGGAE